MEKKCIRNYKQWLWLLPLLGFISVAVCVKQQYLLEIDQVVYAVISKSMHPLFTKVLQVITFMGTSIAMITIGLGILVYNRKKGIFILANLAIIYILNESLKLLFSRARPDVLWLSHASGFSFPSGHTMVSCCFYGICIYWLMKMGKQYHWLSFALTILILCIGFSRIYLGVHYFSDVIGGLLFSLSYLIFIVNNSFFKT